MLRKMKVVGITTLLSFASNAHSYYVNYTGPDEPSIPIVLQIRENNQPYPRGEITEENNYFHLNGFPTFVEITQAGCQKLKEDLEKDFFTINFSARFTESEDPIHFYTLNKDFFERFKNPGLYQPDYLPFNGEGYLSNGSGTFSDQELYDKLKSKMHSLYQVDQSYSWSCGATINREFIRPKGQLISIEGTLVWGSPSDPIDSFYFSEVAYQENLRGIVFMIDALDNQWMTKSRELTEDDITKLKENNELLIPIK